jgi:hypothetical protein
MLCAKFSLLTPPGECDVSSAPVDIRALAADVVRTARVGLAAQSGTCIELDADAGGDDAAHAAPLPPVIHSSAEHLELLLLNLTVFCVRAAEGAPVQVRLRCEKGEEGGVDAPQRLRLLLEVCACGHALSAEQVGAIFEPYMQDNTSEPGLRVRSSPLAGGSCQRFRLMTDASAGEPVAEPPGPARVAPPGGGCARCARVHACMPQLMRHGVCCAQRSEGS